MHAQLMICHFNLKLVSKLVTMFLEKVTVDGVMYKFYLEDGHSDEGLVEMNRSTGKISFLVTPKVDKVMLVTYLGHVRHAMEKLIGYSVFPAKWGEAWN